MRAFAIITVLALSAGISNADLIEYDNPFPLETNSYGMSNIYATSPEAITKEKLTNEKIKKSKWWETKSEDAAVETPVNEGIEHEFYQRGVRAEDSGFIILK